MPAASENWPSSGTRVQTRGHFSCAADTSQHLPGDHIAGTEPASAMSHTTARIPKPRKRSAAAINAGRTAPRLTYRQTRNGRVALKVPLFDHIRSNLIPKKAFHLEPPYGIEP